MKITNDISTGQILIICLEGAAIFTILIYHSTPKLNELHEFYSTHIRASLFTGFLTMGSFLLSLKTFIVVKLKENIFDSTAYKEKIKEYRKTNPKLTLYGPIKNLSNLLFLSIASSIFASTAQLTIGLIKYWATTLFCLFLAATSIFLLIGTLLVIRTVLSLWLDTLEEENNKYLKSETSNDTATQSTT